MTGKNVVGPLFGFLSLILCFVSIVCLFLKAWIAFWIFVVLFTVTLVVFIIFRYKEFVNFFVSRQLRYGTNVTLSIFGVLGIAIFINIIVAQRFDLKADLTELRENSLSEPTQKILKTLDKKVNVIAFFSDPTTSRANSAIDKLRLYERESDFISVSIKNPYIETQLVDTKLIDETIVFKTEEKEESVTIVSEQKFTSAILKLLQNRTKKFFFLEGHGESEIDDFNNSGLSWLKTALENQNYEPNPFSFLTEKDIPNDCELLVIAGPTNPIPQKEIGLIDKYLAKNGKLLVLFNPSKNAEDVNDSLVQLMKKWGISVGNDLVYDMVVRDANLGPSAPAPNFEFHDITRPLANNQLAFPNSRSVTPINNRKPKLIVKSLAKTASPITVSWGETGRKPDGKFSSDGYTPDEDTPAPVSIATAVEELINSEIETNSESNNTRIVVFGSTQFAMNYFFGDPNLVLTANHVLIINTINWLTEDGDLIAITEPDKSKQVLRRMTVQEANLIQIISLFLIPITVFIAGIVVWWQRRVGGKV